MALPSTRLCSSASRATLVRSVFLVACMYHMSIASSDEPFRTVADYPKNCYDGPGPADGDKIELLSPSCIFSLKGLKPDGVYQETGGIVIRTTMGGKWGEMRIQVDLKKDPTSGETKVSMETSGWAHLWFEHDGIGIHWNPASNIGHFTGTSVIPVSVASAVDVYYPENEHSWFSWYGVN
ncbi:hypothetical protein FOZ62_025440, partial [Perkinsus olseni]